MILVPNWYNKGMDTVVLPFDNQLREDTGMCAEDAQIANPPLGSLHFRCIEDESLRLCIVGSSSHQPLHIRPMTELRLRIASQDLSSFRWL